MVDIYTTKESTRQKLEEPPENENNHRPYLGMSQLGHSCERFLWYSFRWCFYDTPSRRMKRLFSRGHSEEDVIIRELSRIGIRIFDEQEEAIALHGHCKGHIDGKAIKVIEAPKTIHLAEFKTLNDKNFKLLRKEGVKVSKPVYFAQAQCYMHSFKLTRALFIGVNKNDDDWHIERLEYEKDVAINLFERGDSIILSEKPPEKKFKPTWYECKWCSAKDICHSNGEIPVNCRTCQSLDLLPQGLWECSKHDIFMTTSQQRIACKKYEMLKWL